jgi:hypothetical protein
MNFKYYYFAKILINKKILPKPILRCTSNKVLIDNRIENQRHKRIMPSRIETILPNLATFNMKFLNFVSIIFNLKLFN